MRARMQDCEVMGNSRRQQNGSPLIEPRSIDEMPDWRELLYTALR